MKKFLLASLFFAGMNPSSLKAQKNYLIAYGEVFNIVSMQKQLPLNDFDRTHLLYTQGDSLSFTSFTLQKPDKKSKTIGGERDHHAYYYFPLLERELHENFYKKPYNIHEAMVTNFKWNLFEDTMTIAGHLCKAAGSNSVRVWYAVDIPLPFGPAIFKGLPGLVMQVEDYRGKQRIYKIISIKESVHQIILPKGDLLACKDCESKLEQMKQYFNN